MKKPGRIRRVLAGEPDRQLEVRYAAIAAIESEDIVRVEHEISIRPITAVSHLAGGGEPTGGVIFADEGELLIVVASRNGIDVAHVDLVLRRVEIQNRIH